MKDSGKQENRECLFWTIGLMIAFVVLVIAAINVFNEIKKLYNE